MTEEEAYSAIDILNAEIAQKKAAIAAIVEELNMEFVIQCLWTEDYTPLCTSGVQAGTKTYFAPYYRQSRAMNRDVSQARVFKLRYVAQWYLDAFQDQGARRAADRLKQIWTVEEKPCDSQ